LASLAPHDRDQVGIDLDLEVLGLDHSQRLERCGQGCTPLGD
jgi:hypothetical protein